MIVQSRVMIVDTGYSYIIVTYSLNDNFVDKSYLEDMNALNGTNDYNNHRVFFSKKRALRYLKLCTELELDVKYNKLLLYNDYQGDIKKIRIYMKYFYKDATGLNSDIERHRKEEQRLEKLIKTLEDSEDSEINKSFLMTHRNSLLVLQQSKAELLSKLGRKH